MSRSTNVITRPITEPEPRQIVGSCDYQTEMIFLETEAIQTSE